jgi:hypothetical protein
MRPVPGALLAISFSVASNPLILKRVFVSLRTELRRRFLTLPTDEAPSAQIAHILGVGDEFVPALFEVIPVRVALAATPMAVWAVVRVLFVVGVALWAGEDNHCGTP